MTEELKPKKIESSTEELPPKNWLDGETIPKDVYKPALIGLISISLISIICMTFLAFYGKSYDAFVAIASASVAGLVAIFPRNNN